eukprot:COSAG01_NODE_23_length_37704_cov_30.005877_6_plen_77_part_00
MASVSTSKRTCRSLIMSKTEAATEIPLHSLPIPGMNTLITRRAKAAVTEIPLRCYSFHPRLLFRAKLARPSPASLD